MYIEFFASTGAFFMTGWLFVLLVCMLNFGGTISLRFWEHRFWTQTNLSCWLVFYLVVWTFMLAGMWYSNNDPFIPRILVGFGWSGETKRFLGMMVPLLVGPLWLTNWSPRIRDFLKGFSKHLIGKTQTA